MSEAQAAVKNPYDTENMPEGGGLTRDGIVTSAQYVVYPMTYKDGRPVVNEKTKEPSYFIGLRITALRINDAKNEGKVDKYEYSAGKKAKPTADGELLVNEKGEPATIYQNSNLGDALFSLERGGFDKRLLFPRVSALVGAKITFEGRNKIGADGKVKTHTYEGKTYNDIEWFPQTYHGGAGTHAGNGSGNGVAADAVTEKADAAVLAAITAAGGSIERKDLIRALATNLKGDADAIKISTLVAQAGFNAGKGWKADGSTFALAAEA